MTVPLVAVFCMPEASHLRRLLAVVGGLARRGVPTAVFTDGRFREPVERVGGRFVDLFERHPLDAADATSQPVPCRYVSFAAHYAEALVAEMERLRPALIVYDTFAVIGLVLGRALDIPYVNVCAGHDMSPAHAVARLEHDRRLQLSESGRRAIDQLRDRWGVHDASPHSYLTGVSPYLNLYCEPEIFLSPAARAALEPLAFFGSLPPPELTATEDGDAGDLASADPSGLRVYASCGSVVWRYYEREALGALAALAEAIAAIEGARALISLGGHALPPALRARLRHPQVAVADYVDQWRVLQSASVFVTHHGLNSTHEAIYHRVPMLSYPFFGDQPRLAARCQELGLAIPASATPRAPVTAEDFSRGLARVVHEGPRLASALARAREWEDEVLAGREAVLERLLRLATH
jgi:UDP:flavonoid glycosyltransferase YjiC (YdhE family)